jgi:anti-anti-sigma factor
MSESRHSGALIAGRVVPAQGEPVLAINVRIISDIVIFDMAGRFSFMEYQLHEKAKELLNAGSRAFILNLTEVSYVDSFGIGQIFSIWTSMRAKEGHVVLLRPNDAVKKVLQATKLDTIFQVFADEPEAIAHLKSL